MRVGLDPDEAQLLTRLISAAQDERSERIARARSPEDLARLEKEARMLETLRVRLAEAHREEILDESVEETFPASDPPARSVVRDRPRG
ncbi:MAG: hypothetical protein E6K80_05745 [Candidatus Eisenbacteria bacterium]|uniref:Uncharacterized protein n=1 Tax=Eiseniibacteriota bacterium TaxID=2212470 RepID=A0A538U665_UNCEI|nr:MAG: hypothetical protein E6K80_05745 [Candidatus Eisenbacteria bacterium]